jgi:GT2 family glycosyltransferase
MDTLCSLCSLCVMVFNRYDLLVDCLRSASRGTIIPDLLYVINNGRDDGKLEQALLAWEGHARVVYTPKVPMGVAESWNWFLDNAPDPRIITNDDVVFGVRTFEAMLSAEGLFISPLKDAAFSCFLIHDECVKIVGRFDETISPGYAYFEDCDYFTRMRAAGVSVIQVESDTQHVGSATLKAQSPLDWEDHHRRFLLAQNNYVKKWGKLPEGRVLQR